MKNNTPTTIAVKGSNAPNIAVEVEPINFIAIVIVSIEIIVGKIDTNLTYTTIKMENATLVIEYKILNYKYIQAIQKA